MDVSLGVEVAELMSLVERTAAREENMVRVQGDWSIRGLRWQLC